MCNALFIFTLVYRVLHRNDTLSNANTNSPGSPCGTPTNVVQLTTIDLGIFVTIASSDICAGGFAMTRAIGGAEKREDGQ